MSKDREFLALYEKAEATATAAGFNAKPTPMVVSERANPLNDASAVKQSWVVEGGVCGFAWIVVKPANSAFGNWLKKNGKAKPAYGGGLQIWVKAFGQSMERKEAYAYAFAKVLSEAGINAYSDSRMD